MNTEKIVRKIVLAPCILPIMERARVREDASAAHCFYLGTNYLKARETLMWAREHSMKTPEPARLFREACLRTKPSYIQWMGRLSEQADSPEWWSLPISTKSPYLSQLFISLAYLDMIRTYLSSNDVSQLFLVIESPAMAEVLEAYFLSCGQDVRRHRRNSAWSPGWAWLDFKRYTFPRLCFLKDEWIKRRHLKNCRTPMPSTGETLTLIRSWFFAGAFQNGRFSDIYFGNLAGLIKTKGRRPLTVLNLYHPEDAERLKGFLESHEGYIAMEQIVGYWDILKIFCRTFFLPSIHFKRVDYNGVDVTPLVEYELRRARFDPTRALALIHVAFVRNLKRRRLLVEAAYFPYENQGWEKLFCLELRRCFPGIWIGGYQHAALFDMQLTYYASPVEIRLAPGPDTILTSGAFSAAHFRQQGYKNIRTVYPVRYSSLDHIMKASPDGHPTRQTTYDFLICTPSAYPETLEMLHRLVNLFSGRSCRVAVKVHNLIVWDVVLDTLRSIGVIVPPDWEVVSGKLTEMILESKAVMWSSSSAYMDALALGKPAIHIVPSHTIDIEWIHLAEGCIHIYPEDTYDILMTKLQGLHGGGDSGAVAAFVRNRLAFHASLEAFLPEVSQVKE